jgi:glutamate carboxypeptidase
VLDPVLQYHQDHLSDSIQLLRALVEHESPTNDKVNTDQLGRFLKQTLEKAGATIEVIPQPVYGDFIRAEFGSGEGQILVLCHFDTVWSLGEIGRRPIYEQDGKIYGPGIFDMKCGVMFSLVGLQAIQALGLKTKRKIVLLYNTEEEVGSPASRPVIEAEAKRSDIVLVLEPTVAPNGALKTARKGVGRFVLSVKGRPSHSGSNHPGGVSALEEVARQIIKLHGMTNYETGTTLNVGIGSGGTRPNVVAAEATAEVDLRVTTLAEADRMTKIILGLTPFHPEAKIEVTGGLNRPPMERTGAIEKLYFHARELAAGMGFELPEAATGGGSDGCFTGALGIPTLDGLGAVGAGGHSYEEHVVISTVAQRAALFTKLLLTL